jgi:hypothetical protein
MVSILDAMLAKARTLPRTPPRLQFLALLRGLMIGVSSSMIYAQQANKEIFTDTPSTDMLEIWSNIHCFNFPYLNNSMIDLENFTLRLGGADIYNRCSENIHQIPFTSRVKLPLRTQFLKQVRELDIDDLNAGITELAETIISAWIVDMVEAVPKSQGVRGYGNHGATYQKFISDYLVVIDSSQGLMDSFFPMEPSSIGRLMNRHHL